MILKELITMLEMRAASRTVHLPGKFGHSNTDNELNCIPCIRDEAKRSYAMELLQLIEDES